MQSNTATEYPPEQRKIFKLAPADDELTTVILSVRMQAIEDTGLSLGARLLFVYLLDLSLRRTTNVRPGVVTVSQMKLASNFGVSERTIWNWRHALIAERYVWMSFQRMPNTWPVDTYHVTAIHPPNAFEEKTTAEGLWGNGERRRQVQTIGHGAREPGQKLLPGVALRRNQLRRAKKSIQSAQVPDIATVSRNQLRPSTETSCDRPSQPVATDSRNQLRPTVATSCEHKKAQGQVKASPDEAKSSLTAEQRSSSPALKPLDGEAELLAALGEIVGPKEMANWGGRWRNRIREDRKKFERVLKELALMDREQRIYRNAGACADDLWKRFA